jgi:hypothetical protein
MVTGDSGWQGVAAGVAWKAARVVVGFLCDIGNKSRW